MEEDNKKEEDEENEDEKIEDEVEESMTDAFGDAIKPTEESLPTSSTTSKRRATEQKKQESNKKESFDAHIVTPGDQITSADSGYMRFVVFFFF